MNDTSIEILGLKWSIIFKSAEEDPCLKECDGYADTSTRVIVIDTMKSFEDSPNRKSDLDSYQQQVIRHEVLHAFLFESGLEMNSTPCECWAKNEEMIDWFAIQYPKIQKVYKELGIDGRQGENVDGQKTEANGEENL